MPKFPDCLFLAVREVMGTAGYGNFCVKYWRRGISCSPECSGYEAPGRSRRRPKEGAGPLFATPAKPEAPGSPEGN